MIGATGAYPSNQSPMNRALLKKINIRIKKINEESLVLDGRGDSKKVLLGQWLQLYRHVQSRIK
jgi:hypothetical protein